MEVRVRCMSQIIFASSEETLMPDKVEVDQVKQDTTENDVLDIDTSDDVDYRNRTRRPSRGTSKSTVGGVSHRGEREVMR